MTEPAETIAYCHACGAPMDVSAVAPFTNVECPQCSKHTRVKREFGPYTLLRRHAIGGMSMVFAAQDNTLNREVALKILSEDYSADERRITAFEEEARITASFSHPNVVRVLRTGRAFDRFYIAMEFVPGGHFEHQIRERSQIPEVEMLPLAIEVAQGLKAAHAAGLIHRDVKPGNILLDAEGHAKLVDFGLALVTHGGSAQATELWATPYYVPPETIEGHAEDFRSDMYAFGATLYHALTGKPPCNEESMATDILREAKKKIVPINLANPALSAETCRLVMKAMAYNPNERFSSYDEMIAALNNALTLVRSGKTSVIGSAAKRRSAKKRREMIILGSSLAAVVIVGVSAMAWSRHHQTKPEAPPVTPPTGNNPPTPPSGPDHAAEIVKNYRAAQAALEAKDYDRAAERFMPLLHNPSVQEPTRSWAGVQAVVAKLLGGKPGEARKLARESIDHAKTLKDEDSIGKNVTTILEKLGQLEPLTMPSATDPTKAEVSYLMACMLAGLKNWEQGLPDQAAKCFASASSVTLQPNDAWATIYQHLARDYLADYQTMCSAVFTEIPTDKAGCDEAVAKLDTIVGSLKTKGRAHYNLRAWQLDLKRKAALIEKSKSKPAPESPTTAGGDAPKVEEVMKRLNGLTAECRFAEAASYLKSLPKDPPGASRASLLTLAELSTVFLSDIEEDLTKEPVNGEFHLKSGETVTRISIDAQKSVMTSLENGQSRACKWGDFAPDALIGMHRLFVKNAMSETERVRRNECAIAYGWLAGNRELAITAANNLSLDSPAFKKRWQAIVDGLPK